MLSEDAKAGKFIAVHGLLSSCCVSFKEVTKDVCLEIPRTVDKGGEDSGEVDVLGSSSNWSFERKFRLVLIALHLKYASKINIINLHANTYAITTNFAP